MPQQNRIVGPGRTARTVLTEVGEQLSVPEDWTLLLPGDGPLTRRVKTKGPTWLVRVKVKNRFISKGIWAKQEHIQAAREELEVKRSAPGYSKRRRQELLRREKKQREYVEDFYGEVVDFLNFHPRYATLATRLARSVTEHATPVGSGTVARTKQIPLKDRACRAVLAWLRHQTTGYDTMTIARVKGRRRQVRRELALQSLEVLQGYREGSDIGQSCPLQRALTGSGQNLQG